MEDTRLKTQGKPCRSLAAVVCMICALLMLTLAAAVLTGCGRSRPSADTTVATDDTGAAGTDSATDDGDNAPDETTSTEGNAVSENSLTGPQNASAAAQSEPASAPTKDPVTAARAVLRSYLDADMAHDGQEMAKYLGGDAAAKFKPDVHGKKGVLIRRKRISAHTVTDANTIAFTVAVRWSPENSTAVKTDTEKYVLKHTADGWKIVSTPANP